MNLSLASSFEAFHWLFVFFSVEMTNAIRKGRLKKAEMFEDSSLPVNNKNIKFIFYT